MDFIDDTVSDDEEDVLVRSSQRLDTSSDGPMPAKRRRLNPFHESDVSVSSSQTDDYELPSHEVPEEENLENPKSKYDNFMHVPVHVNSQHDEFYTQMDQPGSSPSAIRGPRWRKKSPPRRVSASDGQLRPISNNVVAAPIAVATSFEEFDNLEDDSEVLELLTAGADRENGATAPHPMNKDSRSNSGHVSKNFRQTTLFGLNTTQRTVSTSTTARIHNWPTIDRNEPPTHHKIDKEAMKSWVYPLNVGSIRDYQFNIVHRALFHNILVALPTGLGKTFIAATVMLNFFRWTTDAQIVFVAPTKPLVTQQVDACFHIAGIPRSQTTLLTGEVSPAIRAEEWQEKRVFFMTPQTLINDLKNGMADPKKIVLLVVDEAHKATGNYAYVEVVRFLRRFNSSFRVLALTATPGSTVETVQKVIDGLDIARVEIRTEESMDIRSYVHTRNTELQIFDNSDEVDMCLELFSEAVKPVLAKVAGLNVYFSNDPRTMTLYGLMKSRERWSQSEAGRKAHWGLKGTVNACFKPLMSLAHNVELLKFHGIGPFYHKMKSFEEETLSGNGKYAKRIVESDSFKLLMSRTRSWINCEDFVGHPKLSYLNEVVLNHFLDAGNGLNHGSDTAPPSNTRIMIFAHYRDSAEEVNRVLNRHSPMVRSHVFVGQAGTKGSAGMDQRAQNDIIKKFKSGTYNTLVATSIGEEGLDIGEVDLIVCYDCSKSPIRMLQRMGRTGRKRAGKIVLLLMRGKEERDYHAAKDNYLRMQEIIEKGTEFAFHDENSPRIVPREIQPIVDKRIIDIPVENTQLGDLDPRRRKPKTAKKPKKRFNMPDGVETGFTFLGGGKSKKSEGKKAAPKPLIDLEDADLPDLSTVLLSVEEEMDLERRYAQIAGDGTVYVQQVRFDAHPTQIHKLNKTKIVRHSISTQALIRASQSIRRPGRVWDRPAKPTAVSELSQRYFDEEEDEHQRLTRATTVRAPDVEQDEYDANDSFVDDGPLSQAGVSSSPPFDASIPELPISPLKPNDKHQDRFYVSQRSCNQFESDEELPDVSAIGPSLSRSIPKSTSQQGLQRKATTSRQNKRRLIHDSDDE